MTSPSKYVAGNFLPFTEQSILPGRDGPAVVPDPRLGHVAAPEAADDRCGGRPRGRLPEETSQLPSHRLHHHRTGRSVK